MRKFEWKFQDFNIHYRRDFERYGFSVLLERRGLRDATTPYRLWFFAIAVDDEIIEMGPFRWSIAAGLLVDEEVAGQIAQFYAGSSFIAEARNSPQQLPRLYRITSDQMPKHP